MHVVSNIFQGGADWGSGSRTALTHMLLFVFYQMSHLGDFFLKGVGGWVGGRGSCGCAFFSVRSRYNLRLGVLECRKIVPCSC